MEEGFGHFISSISNAKPEELCTTRLSDTGNRLDLSRSAAYLDDVKITVVPFVIGRCPGAGVWCRIFVPRAPSGHYTPFSAPPIRGRHAAKNAAPSLTQLGPVFILRAVSQDGASGRALRYHQRGTH